MTDLDPEAAPPHGTPIAVPSAPPEPARERPHPHAAPHDHAELPAVGEDLESILVAARDLVRIAGGVHRACQDAGWRHIRPGLLRWESRLQGLLRRQPDHDVAALFLREVRVLLNRKDPIA